MMKTMTRDIRLVIDFAFRFLVLLGCLAVGLLMVIGGARAAMAATLKPDVVLTGTVLTLGDLFDGLSEEKARTVLGPAPRPGADMVLNAHTLMRIAASLDLPWRPAAVTDQVRVSTAATIIDAATVEALVKDALVSKGLTGSFSLARCPRSCCRRISRRRPRSLTSATIPARTFSKRHCPRPRSPTRCRKFP